MPLTPAHAAAALPLHAAARRLRLPLPLAALVIGSMTPDFEYLLRLRPRGDLGHSPIGLVVFCLPVGLAAWAAFRWLVAPALLPLLPAGLSGEIRSGKTSASGPALFALAAVAVILGAASHDLWDSFTHVSGRGLFWFPALERLVAPDIVPDLRWFQLLQHVSTIVGLGVLVIAVTRWVLRQPPEALRFAPRQASRSLRWVIVLVAVATLGAVTNGARGLRYGRTKAVAYGAVGGMATLAVSLLAYGLAARVRPASGPADDSR